MSGLFGNARAPADGRPDGRTSRSGDGDRRRRRPASRRVASRTSHASAAADGRRRRARRGRPPERRRPPIRRRPPLGDSITADQLSLGRRLRQPRTIISLVLPIILLRPLRAALPGFHLEELPGLIAGANPAPPARGVRRLLPRLPAARLALGDPASAAPASGSKVRGQHRDHLHQLARQLPRAGEARRRLSRLPAEDQLPGLAVADVRDRVHRADPRPVRDRRSSASLPASSASATGCPTEVQLVFAIGVDRRRGPRGRPADDAQLRAPADHQAAAPAPRPRALRPVRGGRLRGRRDLGRCRSSSFITALIWTTEAMRLFLVVEALGFPDVHLGISGAFFVALTGSLLTAVPLTPAGLGVVETGVIGVLTIVYGVPQTEALAIVLVDRSISVLSVIGFGSIAYWRHRCGRARGSSRRRCPSRAGDAPPPDPRGRQFATARPVAGPDRASGTVTPPTRGRNAKGRALRGPGPVRRSILDSDSAPRSCARTSVAGPGANDRNPSSPLGRIPEG